MGGGIFTSANPAFTQDELAYQLKDSRARFLLAANLYLEKVFEGAKLAAMIGRRYKLSNHYKEKSGSNLVLSRIGHGHGQPGRPSRARGCPSQASWSG